MENREPASNDVIRPVSKSRKHRSDKKFVILTVLCLLLGGLVASRHAWAQTLASLYPATNSTSANLSLNSDQQAAINGQIRRLIYQPVNISLGSEALKTSPKLLHSWLAISSSSGQPKLSVNQQQILSFLTNQAKSYSASPQAEITATLSNNQNIVLQTGKNGISFNSLTSFASNIASQLMKGQGIKASLAAVITPFSVTNHLGDSKLIEVNITSKVLYAYEDGVLVKTFLVSAGAPATPTPTGTFHIWDKLTVQDMYAYYPNGQLEYNQPNVRYINYFDHNGDAIHGNYWRPLSYFGHINSSHGCVGLTNSDAEWIYNWAPIGTTVVIHA